MHSRNFTVRDPTSGLALGSGLDDLAIHLLYTPRLGGAIYNPLVYRLIL